MAFEPDRYIEIPGDKIREAVAAAYNLSRPQGLGFLHAKPGGLEDAEIDGIIERGVSMDYVHGRACKFSIHEQDGRHFVGPRWYDHSDSQLAELLTAVGIEEPEAKIAAAQEAQDAANAAYRAERQRA